MAGYSGTPLPKKLGIKPGSVVALVGPPPDFESLLGELPPGITLTPGIQDGAPFDVIVFFTKKLADLKRRFAAIAQRLNPSGGVWIAWPKKASGVVTDLTEDIIRIVGLDEGLVDNKVCAIDDTWSGLRFVVRVKDRPARSRK
ncbi:MAG TPA: hypothetical protein VKE94_03570 [Gemmataceae bacterium]|nr:hypothetical protein [Gemmataceae bacterium]